MAKTEQNARVKRGGSHNLRVGLTDENGDPLNLAGITLHYRVARVASSSAPELVITDADIGRDGSTAIIPLTTERTQQIPARRWYHELYMIDPEGERSVLMIGHLTVVSAQAAKHD